MKENGTALAQRWRCGICGAEAGGEVLWSGAWCTTKHRINKMSLIEGELPPPRDPTALPSRPKAKKANQATLTQILKEIASG